MLPHSGILLLIVLGRVWAGVKCQRSNAIFAQKNSENYADGEILPLLSVAEAEAEAIGNEGEFEGKNFKLPEKFHPENDRDADPVEGMKKKTKTKSEPSARKHITKMVSFSDEKENSTVTDLAEDLSAFSFKEKKKKTKNSEEKKNSKTKKEKKPSIENLELEGEEEYTPEQPEPKLRELDISNKLKHLKGKETNLRMEKSKNLELEGGEDHIPEQYENHPRKLKTTDTWTRIKNKKPRTENPDNSEWEGQKEHSSENPAQDREEVKNPKKVQETESTTAKRVMTEEPEQLKGKDGNAIGIEDEPEMQFLIGFGKAEEGEGTIREDPTVEETRNLEDVSPEQESLGTEETKDLRLSYDIELSSGKARILTFRMNLTNLMKNFRKAKILRKLLWLLQLLYLHSINSIL